MAAIIIAALGKVMKAIKNIASNYDSCPISEFAAWAAIIVWSDRTGKKPRFSDEKNLDQGHWKSSPFIEEPELLLWLFSLKYPAIFRISRDDQRISQPRRHWLFHNGYEKNL